MRGFGIGDIVKIKGKVAYFIITDITDWSIEGDETPDIQYEIMQIFPVVSANQDTVTFDVGANDLLMVADISDKENQIIIDYVLNERRARNIHGVPKYLEKISGYSQTVKEVVSPPAKAKAKKTTPKKPKVKVTFDAKEIQRILNDDTAHKKTESYLEKLDTHLQLLHTAIQENNQDEISFQKEQLEKVRQVLMELEYFQLEKRRSGTSIKIK